MATPQPPNGLIILPPKTKGIAIDASAPVIRGLQARSPGTVPIEEVLRKVGRKMEGALGEMLMPLTVARGTEIFTKKVEHIREMGRLMNGDAPFFFSEGDKLALRKLWSLFETMEDGNKRVGMDTLRKEGRPFEIPEPLSGKIKKSISRGERDAIQSVEAGPFAGSRATGFLQPDGRLSSILIHTMSLQADASGKPVEVPNKAILIVLPG